jgi:hypothetical protein
MVEQINEAVVPMINDGLISVFRIEGLFYIKEFINRISSKKYLEEASIEKINQKCGVMPTVTSWGDYFQTEMASSLMCLSDDEFDKAVDTLRFDMMASYIIFHEKNEDFFKWIENSHNDILSLKCENFTEEEEEILHLRILMDYYLNCGVIDRFTDAEWAWYNSYCEAQVV